MCHGSITVLQVSTNSLTIKFLFQLIFHFNRALLSVFEALLFRGRGWGALVLFALAVYQVAGKITQNLRRACAVAIITVANYKTPKKPPK